MEDAADFTFESAKACHVVVLTTMEADKLDWFDTDGLDRIRRSKAQRHPAQSKNVTFEKTSESENPSTHSCNRSGSHTTKGVLYINARHVEIATKISHALQSKKTRRYTSL